jgi:hypothetical protein
MVDLDQVTRSTNMRSTTLKHALVAAIPRMVAGLTKYYAGQTLALNNTTMTVEQVIAALTTLSNQVAEAEATRTLATVQTLTADATAQGVAPLMSALHCAIQGRFGKTNVAVEEFGMSPVKRGARTVASKVEAVAKSLATRAERHTMGKRQKAAIHGTVPAPAAAEPLTPDGSPKP